MDLRDNQHCAGPYIPFTVAKRCKNVNLVLQLTSVDGNVFLWVFPAAVGGDSVCVCVCPAIEEWSGCCSSFYFEIWAPHMGQCALPALQPWMGSTSSHSLRGADLTSLRWQIRQSSFGQQQSWTIQMLISNCTVGLYQDVYNWDLIEFRPKIQPGQIRSPTAYL